MKTHTLHREQWIAHPLSLVFGFFSEPANLERLTPPWLRFQILTPDVAMREGAQIEYSLRVRGFLVRWRSEIAQWSPPHQFIDVQLKGPYKLWHHTHRFAEARGGTRIEDTVLYALPFGILGRIAHRVQVSKDIEAIFRYRTERVEEEIAKWSASRERGGAPATPGS